MPETSQFTLDEAPWSEAAAVLSAIRREVFIVEQGVPEALEWDGLDPQCSHILARDAAGRPIGTGRLLPDGHIGRMAVVKGWRGRGVGRALLDRLVEMARSRGMAEVALNAQTWALGFYEKAGFEAYGDEFPDAGILHRAMKRTF